MFQYVFDDGLDRYLYALCSGMESDPLGFYFKWLQYDGEDQIDPDLYLSKDWKIVWLPTVLSDKQIKSLGKDRYLPEFTNHIN